MGTKINDLSKEEFTSLLDGYFKPTEQRYQLTETELKDLAVRLNDKINVPLINEIREEKILLKIVLKIDTFLYDHLPNEFYDLIRSMDKGISDKEAKRLIIRLTTLANNKLDIPYIPAVVEKIAIKYIIELIINGARKKFKLFSEGTLIIPSKLDKILSKENYL